jgi:hypothetical protein
MWLVVINYNMNKVLISLTISLAAIILILDLKNYYVGIISSVLLFLFSMISGKISNSLTIFDVMILAGLYLFLLGEYLGSLDILFTKYLVFIGSIIALLGIILKLKVYSCKNFFNWKNSI